VHRDLKPENLLLSMNKGVEGILILKIGDFGCAKEIGCHESGTRLMLTDRGSYEYAAPELALGLVWNERIDVWAVGLCSYFMLAGVLPFSILDSQILDIMRQGMLPNIHWMDLSDNMIRFVTECLTVKMENRPSAMELDVHRALPKKINSSWAPAKEVKKEGRRRGTSR